MKGTISALAVAGALMLAGCGGGGKSASMAGGPSPTSTPTPAPTPTFEPGTIPLPKGHTLQTGTISAGESRTVRETDGMETVVVCSAGSENCRITVAADGTVTLIAGSLRIEIRGIRVVTPTTPLPPTTPPVPVFESPLISWRELPALVERYDHWTQIQSSDFPGTSCDDGVTACRTLVKSMLTHATEETEVRGWDGGERFGGRAASWLGKRFSGTMPDAPAYYPAGYPTHFGGWLDNSIFIVYRRDMTADDPGRPTGQDAYFNDITSGSYYQRLISMGIRDTNPVTGVYRGDAVDARGVSGYFELNYTSGATGGQLSATITVGSPMTWSNVPVDNNGAFDNGIRPADHRETGPNQLTGRFYQGGEVGGVFVYNTGSHWRNYGAFGGKLSPDGP